MASRGEAGAFGPATAPETVGPDADPAVPVLPTLRAAPIVLNRSPPSTGRAPPRAQSARPETAYAVAFPISALDVAETRHRSPQAQDMRSRAHCNH